MQVYFAGAIPGGRELVSTTQSIVNRLKSMGHLVPTEHVASPTVLEDERRLSPSFVYKRDFDWISGSEALIAEVSLTSLGVGYEIACALHAGKPVLCLHRAGGTVSKMISGNPSPGLRVVSYADNAELEQHLDSFIAEHYSVRATPREAGNREPEGEN
jgi:2'-deoxynucleoside 5'-phosphate N-hydrolase